MNATLGRLALHCIKMCSICHKKSDPNGAALVIGDTVCVFHICLPILICMEIQTIFFL